MTGALDGITILDLTRILAGPTCTQLLGDLGAQVIKIENPGSGGDDTRTWGPPYVMDAAGNQTDLSAYFMASNRNKLSVAIDIATAEGQATVRALAAKADILVENFKPGGLARYGLDHATLCAAHPRLIYCSISGFGQTGPNAAKPGYDLMAQGYGGMMSLTGEPDGPPMKVGVGVADVICGLYAATRHNGRPAPPQQDRAGATDRRGAGRHPDRLAGERGGQLPDLRPGAAAARQWSCQYRAVSGVRSLGRPCHRRGRQ